MKIFISYIIFIIIFIVIFIIALNACNKNSEEPELIPVFQVGIVNDYMNYKVFDPPLLIVAEPDSSAQRSFDIDADGYNDTHIFSLHGITPNGDSIFRANISVGVTFSMSSFMESDIIHRCLTNVNDSLQILTYYNQLSDFICTEPGIDTIYNDHWGQYHYPIIHQYGEKPIKEINWETSFHILALRDSSNFTTSLGGTIIIDRWDIIRGYWNNVDEKYILIKREKPFKDYFGWIKLSVKNYKEIYVHEYAFEKY